MTPTNKNDEAELWKDLKNNLKSEYEKAEQELRELDVKLTQCSSDMNKLTQNNATITGQIQRIQNQLELVTKNEIITTYDTAMDAQQRLFLLRGQFEKVSSDRDHMLEFLTWLKQVQNTLKQLVPEEAYTTGVSSKLDSVMMSVQAQEIERQRLSRQMHDGPAQTLSNFILQTEIAMRLFEIDQEKAKEELLNIKNSSLKTFQNIKDFIFDLRPMMMDDLGLVPTLRRYIESFQNQANIEIELNISGRERRLESYLEIIIFRAIQECLENVLRHSQASKIGLKFDLGESLVRTSISDNGKGFDASNLDDNSTMGLNMIRDRIEMLSGSFEITSILGEGTLINFQIPAIEQANLS